LPILVLTVDERQELADQFLTAGATDFALKPIKAPDLISRINVHLRYRGHTVANTKVAGVGQTGERARRLAQSLPDISGVNRPTLFTVLEALVRARNPLTAAEVDANPLSNCCIITLATVVGESPRQHTPSYII
jgi:two-component system response regulator DctR